MTNEQIKNYLKKYRIDSEEQLAKHIEELKRNTIPNNEIIFPLVDLLVNKKAVLNSFFAENKKQEMFTRTVTPFFLDEMLGKCSTQCFCDGSCKKSQEKKLGGYSKPNVYINSTRHKAREEGKFHKEIAGDLEGINRPSSTHNGLQKYINKLEQYKDDVITNSNRGEKDIIEHFQASVVSESGENLYFDSDSNLIKIDAKETQTAYKETAGKLFYELDWGFITQMAERMASNKKVSKYDLWNWKKPMTPKGIEDLKQATLRHLLEVLEGRYEDDGRQFGHLEAISDNMMMINYQLKS